MFLILIFPLANQIETLVIVWKLKSLRFNSSICLLLSNEQICIPKTLNIQIKNPKKIQLWIPYVPFLVHPKMQSPYWCCSLLASSCLKSSCKWTYWSSSTSHYVGKVRLLITSIILGSSSFKRWPIVIFSIILKLT